MGTGFEIFENLLYAIQSEDLGGAVNIIVARTTMGFGLHLTWTAIAAAAVAFVWGRPQRGQSSRWWVIIPAYLLPMMLHAAWDSPGSSSLQLLRLFDFVLLYAFTLALFFTTILLSRRNEWREYGGSLTPREWRTLGRTERLSHALTEASDTAHRTATAHHSDPHSQQ